MAKIIESLKDYLSSTTTCDTKALRSFAKDHNEFALVLYKQLSQTPANVFFSPFSVRTALGMTYAGARGEPAVQMSWALRFPSSDETLHVAFKEILSRLDVAGSDKYELGIANSLWSQDGAPLQAEFHELIARYYGGAIHPVDFLRNAELVRKKINGWVESKTKQKIRELIPEKGVDANTRLVLVNAIYFKGRWELPFSKYNTMDDVFFDLEDGREVRTPLMYQQEEVRYLQADDFQAVDLDYQGGDLSMLVLLPDKQEGLRDLETKLTTDILYECVEKMAERQVKLWLPRFKMTWGTVDLAEHLIALGMPLAFTRYKADFSGINGYMPPDEESLFFSAVFHKAFVEVKEEGTEAAAATAVDMKSGGAEPWNPPQIPVFRADHPFLFAIRDRKSGAILFLGRVANPTQES